jgi:Fe-S cluster assembly scaffold IscU
MFRTALRRIPRQIYNTRLSQSQRRWKYSEQVLDHYRSPRNAGKFSDEKAKDVGVAMVGAPSCGDVLKFSIRIGEDGKVQDAKFLTFGCGSAIASSSYATELAKGKTLEDCMRITNRDIASYLALPPIKKHCSLLAEEALKKAIEDYRSKN